MPQIESATRPINMPTADMPLSETPDQKPSQIWWRFWFALLTRTLQTIQATTNNAVTAAGTTQGTATVLDSEWNVVTSVPANSGVVMNGFDIGISVTVFNQSIAILKVYPPSGMEIDSLGANVPYSLASVKTQTFSQVSTTQFISTQLG